MKVKMYGWAIKHDTGRFTFSAESDEQTRADCMGHYNDEAQFTFEIDLDPAALFPAEPVVSAGEVEAE